MSPSRLTDITAARRARPQDCRSCARSLILTVAEIDRISEALRDSIREVSDDLTRAGHRLS